MLKQSWQELIDVKRREDVLNKIKKMFMKEEPPLMVPDINSPGQLEDSDYIEHSAEAVGYGNRKLQWNTYRSIANYIPEGDSVLDFGCARGDFKLFHADDYTFDLDYIGIDMNENLINAGKKVYEDRVDIRLQDWFKMPTELKQDWCINIGSSNLRYDADIKSNDQEYLEKTINTMYDHANKGMVILLTSSLSGIDDGLINRDPGLILNWAQKEFGDVALDHSFSKDVFILVIYK